MFELIFIDIKRYIGISDAHEKRWCRDKRGCRDPLLQLFQLIKMKSNKKTTTSSSGVTFPTNQMAPSVSAEAIMKSLSPSRHPLWCPEWWMWWSPLWYPNFRGQQLRQLLLFHHLFNIYSTICTVRRNYKLLQVSYMIWLDTIQLDSMFGGWR